MCVHSECETRVKTHPFLTLSRLHQIGQNVLARSLKTDMTHIYGIGVTHTCFEAFSVSQFVRFAFNSNQPLKTFTNIHGHYMGIHVKYSSFGSTQLVHFNTNYANIHKTMQHKKLSHKAPSVRRRTRKLSGWFVKFVAVHGFE